MLIEDLTINNDSTIFQPLDEIELSHADNNLSFRFTIVDFENTNYQFSYRLNRSSSWNRLGPQHNLSFNNLSPGKYLVELSAVGKPGIRKSKSILVLIQPPFWKEIWFICLSILLVLAVAFLLFRERLKRVRQKAQIDRKLSQTQMKALQSQMNPHFIFNSLNSIREMILSGANKDASHYLSQFAQLIRITLEQSTEEMVLLRTTIEYLHRYIEMETIRNEFIKYEIYVDNQIDQNETLVSPMIIQPFVENAIWHGVSATRKDIKVRIEFKQAGDCLLCTVEDDGIGISHSQSLKKLNGMQRRSHGISNVQERIKLLSEKYNIPCSVTIVDKKDGLMSHEPGTLVSILLPYQTTD